MGTWGGVPQTEPGSTESPEQKSSLRPTVIVVGSRATVPWVSSWPIEAKFQPVFLQSTGILSIAIHMYLQILVALIKGANGFYVLSCWSRLHWLKSIRPRSTLSFVIDGSSRRYKSDCVQGPRRAEGFP